MYFCWGGGGGLGQGIFFIQWKNFGWGGAGGLGVLASLRRGNYTFYPIIRKIE